MKNRRRRNPEESRGRGIYILPNLFTSASLFGGFYAVIAAIQGRFEAAALAVIISGICDGIDGRIARFTHTTSHFGVEFDSLSDLVAFGVAPAILAFRWALEPLGRLGWLAAFMYVICGALRLARFNIQKTVSDPNFFKGLPIPSAACFISSLILFTGTLGWNPGEESISMVVMMFALSFLMVSTVRYPSFKGFDIRHRKPFHVLVSTILIFVVIAYQPCIMFFLIMFVYTLSGPAITAYGKRMRSRGLEESADETEDQERVHALNERHDSIRL